MGIEQDDLPAIPYPTQHIPDPVDPDLLVAQGLHFGSDEMRNLFFLTGITFNPNQIPGEGQQILRHVLAADHQIIHRFYPLIDSFFPNQLLRNPFPCAPGFLPRMNII